MGGQRRQDRDGGLKHEKQECLTGASYGTKGRLCGDQASDLDARPQYSAFRLDDKLPDAFSRLHKATPEPRHCVYGVPESIPFYRGER